ncbi:hypothetical protein [Mesorhizobium sp. M0276]|uniref:hypothetical protein n=1 Tax=Mesorhizobium sp. M0276 TaxID=2956928 RepID=UPI0033394E6B
MGVLDWETVVVTIDLVLGVVWAKRAGRLRERLFEKIVHDLDLGAQARLSIDWATNYGMSILFAWLFGQWPEHLQKLWTIMAAPAIDDAVACIAPVAAEPLRQLRKLCRCITRKSIDNRKSAIDWLMALPETGADLRRRGARIHHSGLHRKLVVLAMLRDGLDLSVVAATERLRPDTIRIWLENGMEHGLEAMVARPVRGRDLSEDQEREIGAWLATIRGRARGHGAWSAEQVQYEIMQRFDIKMTAASALSLLRANTAQSARSWDFGQLEGRCGNIACGIDQVNAGS